MLALEDIHIQQGSFSLRANWSVAPGERVALIGPSGSGKSTLLTALAGFLAPSSGRLMFSDKLLNDLEPSHRPMSILFQDQNLFPHLTLLQNLGLGIAPDLRLSATQTEKVHQSLTAVGLEGFGDRKPAQLSGGQQSRAALARALLRSRPILLLDEPFAALGPAMKAEMLALLDQVAGASNSIVLMVTHDPHDALSFADKTVVFSEGIAAPPAMTQELFAQPTRALAHYLGV